MTVRKTIVVLLVSTVLPCSGARAAGCVANGAFGGFRAFLTDCREYELVTPPFKDGSPPEELPSGLSTISSDGNHVLATDTGGFAGAESDELNGKQKGAVYESTRAANGWITEAIAPPAERASRSLFAAESADFSRSLWELGVQGEAGEEVQSTSQLFTLALRKKTPGATATLTEIGPEDPPGAPARSFSLEGASSDLSTIVFSNVGKKVHWPGDKTRQGSDSLYAYTGTHNREPMLVGVKNIGPLVGSTQRNEHAELISECGTQLGSSSAPGGNTRNAVSDDGSVIYFTALRGTCEPPAVNELYARIDAERTVAISEPAMTPSRESECSLVCREDETSESGRAPAIFQGASKDGTKVFFTTEQPLLDLDRDTGNDLYEAELEGGKLARLTMVSRGRTSGGPGVEDATPGENADVFAVARVSDDGGHVYFIARGELTKAANGGGEVPQAGGYDLYDHDSVTGVTSLVAVWISPAETLKLEAAVIARVEVPVLEKQARCESLPELGAPPEEVEECEAQLERLREALPAEVAKAMKVEVQASIGPKPSEKLFATTADGRYLIFMSVRHLTGAEDTSTVPQLFEYDANTAVLRRASIGYGGYNNNGNTENLEYVPRIVVPNDAQGGEPTSVAASLSVSRTGSVFFTSRDRLTPSAMEGHENVYEYEPPASGSCGLETAGGCLSLISAGDEAFPAEVRGKPRLLGTDPAGDNVFFVSANNLLPRDADSQLDWYDARIEGGFEEVSAGPGCGEETCQGPPVPTPSMPSLAGSAMQSGEAPVALVPDPPTLKLTAKRSLSPAQKLTKALRACRTGSRKKRRACETQARRRLAKKHAAKKSDRRLRR
jgi:hypothetical protein